MDDEGNTVEATYMTDAEYDEQLKQKGKEELAKSENSVTKSFEGEIDGSRQFVYKKISTSAMWCRWSTNTVRRLPPA